MVRPTEYPVKRRDTKVRLREDHASALAKLQDEEGKSRNRLIEEALDAYLAEPIRPRLRKAPSDPKIMRQATPGRRTAPRLRNVGEEAAAQAEAEARPAPAVKTAKSRRSPRRFPQ